ncbi:MAG TPA: hypothetical protein VFT43_06035, partial [Candidatus Polarisedimenticolia bacterium]|nr:hypothetical protein [Candidatus Polarisedimenticolia bacterium]
MVACLPVRAATLVTTSDGRTYAVWERRAPSAIAFSFTDATESAAGIIPVTDDVARDTSPALALDPRTGSVVAVWSRFDGSYFKIAYARLESGIWVDFHYLTFGRGNDALPRLGS